MKQIVMNNVNGIWYLCWVRERVRYVFFDVVAVAVAIVFVVVLLLSFVMFSFVMAIDNKIFIRY